MAKTRRHKRAIESYIAVIILVIVTLAIGVALYTYFNGLVAHNQANTGLEITSVSLSAPSGGTTGSTCPLLFATSGGTTGSTCTTSGGTTGYLSITVQNTGSLTLKNIIVVVNGPGVSTSTTLMTGSGASATPVTINPGQSYSAVLTITGATAGNEYAVYVSASTSTGSSVSSSVVNVIAQG
ncbi:hypothetical protein B9Q03_09625 [Candidatus Marsarchaeota G2 archaeon OSP_D]|jgi:hypothetical protein|uniref:CARDB domain-containing protein n=2 Tax=Candidatus Marsarchaeota G2 archaeon OSP_D TaxID=1978157 RepID=A0A2R6AP26_9ARCH|nr:MAG: hypothetical protein B9Q03_09625 [Candidatus Marsarchaeota G2 archaeon OSP_D]